MTKFEILNEAERRTSDSAMDAVMVDYSGGDHDFGRCTRWLWTGGGGSLVARMASGKVLDFQGLQECRMMPISISAVLTGSSATPMVAFF
ncbi:hypothetical protein [Haloferula sp. BvORR071]|uniref:spike base protein, RCAP_Rcc01079 family n=1 Tax=Haloferula sp. BvORR071 TaxID=1396141 RepID=UPI002240F020|nr:hypothetical protein [Haloferula sp. BvORR071]